MDAKIDDKIPTRLGCDSRRRRGDFWLWCGRDRAGHIQLIRDSGGTLIVDHDSIQSHERNIGRQYLQQFFGVDGFTPVDKIELRTYSSRFTNVPLIASSSREVIARHLLAEGIQNSFSRHRFIWAQPDSLQLLIHQGNIR